MVGFDALCVDDIMFCIERYYDYPIGSRKDAFVDMLKNNKSLLHWNECFPTYQGWECLFDWFKLNPHWISNQWLIQIAVRNEKYL